MNDKRGVLGICRKIFNTFIVEQGIKFGFIRFTSDEVVEPSLWYYNDMMFIRGQLPETQKSPVDQSQTKKRASSDEVTKELVGLATQYFKRPESEVDIKAKGWAMKLCRLAPNQKRFAEK